MEIIVHNANTRPQYNSNRVAQQSALHPAGIPLRSRRCVWFLVVFASTKKLVWRCCHWRTVALHRVSDSLRILTAASCSNLSVMWQYFEKFGWVTSVNLTPMTVNQKQRTRQSIGAIWHYLRTLKFSKKFKKFSGILSRRSNMCDQSRRYAYVHSK